MRIGFVLFAILMFSNLISSAAICLAIWVFWKVYHRLRLSPLDNIAGPPSTSVLKGKFLLPIYVKIHYFNYVSIPGNFTEFFANNTREYQIDLLQKCTLTLLFASYTNVPLLCGKMVVVSLSSSFSSGYAKIFISEQPTGLMVF